MTLVRVNPNRGFKRRSSFSTDFDRVFDEFFKTDIPQGKQPAVNVLETGDGFTVELAVPGLSKEAIQVKVENKILSISAAVKQEQAADTKFRKHEFDYSNFKRSFQLPKTVDASAITANYEQGILSVFIPKREEAKALPPRTKLKLNKH